MDRVNTKRERDEVVPVRVQGAIAGPLTLVQHQNQKDEVSTKVSRVSKNALEKSVKPTIAGSMSLFFTAVSGRLGPCISRTDLERYASQMQKAKEFGSREINIARLKFATALSTCSPGELIGVAKMCFHPYIFPLKGTIIKCIKLEQKIASSVRKDKIYLDLSDEALYKRDFLSASFFASRIKRADKREQAFLEVLFEALAEDNSLLIGAILGEGFRGIIENRNTVLLGLVKFAFSSGDTDRGLAIGEQLKGSELDASYHRFLRKETTEMQLKGDIPSLLKIIKKFPRDMDTIESLVDAGLLQRAIQMADSIKDQDEDLYDAAMKDIGETYFANHQIEQGFACAAKIVDDENRRLCIVLGHTQWWALDPDPVVFQASVERVSCGLCRADIYSSIGKAEEAFMEFQKDPNLSKNPESAAVLREIFDKLHECGKLEKTRMVFGMVSERCDKALMSLKIEPLFLTVQRVLGKEMPNFVLSQILSECKKRNRPDLSRQIYCDLSPEDCFSLQVIVDDFEAAVKNLKALSIEVFEDNEEALMDPLGPRLDAELTEDIVDMAGAYVNKLCQKKTEQGRRRALQIAAFIQERDQRAKSFYRCFKEYLSIGNKQMALHIVRNMPRSTVYKACAFMDIGEEKMAIKELGAVLGNNANGKIIAAPGFEHFVKKHLARGLFEKAREVIRFIECIPTRIDMTLLYHKARQKQTIK